MTFIFCNPTINRKRWSQVVAIGGASVKSVKTGTAVGSNPVLTTKIKIMNDLEQCILGFLIGISIFLLFILKPLIRIAEKIINKK